MIIRAKCPICFDIRLIGDKDDKEFVEISKEPYTIPCEKCWKEGKERPDES